ncbi:MAG: winged helix-turn-helix transcriptional regulator [Deltaproteobacteria bacterium]|nr:winged helix-turn-helix transcriptional regulator [Deltaproteobacteria bacterium]
MNQKTTNPPTNFIRLLLKCGTFLQREGNRMARDYGIKQQQFVVLNEIVINGPVNQKKIIGELLFEKSNVSKIIKVLLKKEMIKVEQSKTDSRVTLLTCTSQGYKVWQNCINDMDKWSKSFTSDLSKEEITHSIQILEKLLTMTNVNF